jgi:hypothetical protein
MSADAASASPAAVYTAVSLLVVPYISSAPFMKLPVVRVAMAAS